MCVNNFSSNYICKSLIKKYNEVLTLNLNEQRLRLNFLLAFIDSVSWNVRCRNGSISSLKDTFADLYVQSYVYKHNTDCVYIHIKKAIHSFVTNYLVTARLCFLP